MIKFEHFLLSLLRMSLGWYFFWAGISKVLDPDWSAAGFLLNAKMFPGFYAFFADPSILPVVNGLNEWGLTLVGVALILGVSVRFSAYVGAMFMLLYYFPHENTHSLIVDEHIIYALALLSIASIKESRVCGFYDQCIRLPIVRKSPLFQKFLF